jgi:hypothetical protein
MAENNPEACWRYYYNSDYYVVAPGMVGSSFSFWPENYVVNTLDVYLLTGSVCDTSPKDRATIWKDNDYLSYIRHTKGY